MILAWLVWPIVLLVAIVGKALWRSLRHWKIPVLSGLVAIPGMYVVLLIATYVDPARPRDQNNNYQSYEYMVLWWNRWRRLGVARLIPNDWQMKMPHYPNNTEMWSALLHLFAAAGLTVACLILALLFVACVLNTLSTVGNPYQGGVR